MPKARTGTLYPFVYACPICSEDAFLLEQRLMLENGTVAVADVINLLSWEDGQAKSWDSMRCQRCRAKIRFIDPARIEMLKCPFVVPPKE